MNIQDGSDDLELQDFQIANQNDEVKYYKYEFDKYQICIEPCLNGFDVAIYDTENLSLLEPKRCTNVQVVEGENRFDRDVTALKRVKEYVNYFYHKYKPKSGSLEVKEQV